jgi:hypothetical protein
MRDRNIKTNDNWATPDSLINELEYEFGPLFDPCPLFHNIKDWNGLEIEWNDKNYINPPYSKKIKEQFILKAIEESKKGKLCIMLIPVSTSSKIFHDYILPNKKEIRFIRGRIPFSTINEAGQLVKNGTGMHDSMIVVFDGRKESNENLNTGNNDKH